MPVHRLHRVLAGNPHRRRACGDVPQPAVEAAALGEAMARPGQSQESAAHGPDRVVAAVSHSPGRQIPEIDDQRAAPGAGKAPCLLGHGAAHRHHQSGGSVTLGRDGDAPALKFGDDERAVRIGGEPANVRHSANIFLPDESCRHRSRWDLQDRDRNRPRGAVDGARLPAGQRPLVAKTLRATGPCAGAAPGGRFRPRPGPGHHPRPRPGGGLPAGHPARPPKRILVLRPGRTAAGTGAPPRAADGGALPHGAGTGGRLSQGGRRGREVPAAGDGSLARPADTLCPSPVSLRHRLHRVGPVPGAPRGPARGVRGRRSAHLRARLGAEPVRAAGLRRGAAAARRSPR